MSLSSFFFNDTATTEIYTLSLHDALPISAPDALGILVAKRSTRQRNVRLLAHGFHGVPDPDSRRCRVWYTMEARSEEHTSELQSHLNLVCRLLLEKKKNTNTHPLPRITSA